MFSTVKLAMIADVAENGFETHFMVEKHEFLIHLF